MFPIERNMTFDIGKCVEIEKKYVEHFSRHSFLEDKKITLCLCDN